ncbi:MAG: HAD family hydrolase [Acidimicrobiales bacterium]
MSVASGDGGPVVRGILFDLGGTLFSYRFRRQMGQANVVALRRLGLDPEERDVRDAQRRASEAVQREYAQMPSFLHRDLFRDRVRRTAELLGVTATDDVLAQFDVENVQAILDHMPAREDSALTLEALGERGIYRAVVSNADDAWVEPALRRSGLDQHLEHWTSSEEAHSCKPDPGIFRYALDKAGIGRAEVLYVGDSPHHDVVGAHGAGIRTVLLTDHDGAIPLSSGLHSGVEPDYRIESLTDVVGIVDELNPPA